jgi:hypothetical protein
MPVGEAHLRLEPHLHSILSQHYGAEDELLGRCFQGAASHDKFEKILSH